MSRKLLQGKGNYGREETNRGKDFLWVTTIDKKLRAQESSVCVEGWVAYTWGTGSK